MWIAVNDIARGWIVFHTTRHEQYPVSFNHCEQAARDTALALNLAASYCNK